VPLGILQHVRGRSEKEIMVATEDIHRQRSLQSRRSALNARKLAEFLQSLESKETLLVQRARDRKFSTSRRGCGCEQQAQAQRLQLEHWSASFRGSHS
jgi:hypothetical protein